MPKAQSSMKNQGILGVLGEVTPEDDVIEGEIDDSLFFDDLDDAKEVYNMCFWGREGSGKTTALAHMANVAPPSSKILVINAEGGLKKKALQRLGIDTSKIAVWPKAGQAITFKNLDALYRKIKEDLSRDPNSWFAVGWDSVTEIHASITSEVSASRIQRARDRDVVVEGVDEFFVDVSDYGTMTKIMNDLLRKFRDLPCHFVVTALERRDVDEQTGKVTYGPAITPGLQSAILGYTDLNLAFKAADEDGPFRALTKGGGTIRAKDRMGGLPRVLAQPWFDRVLAYQNGELIAEEDPLQAALPAPKAPRKKRTPGARKR